MGTDLLSEQWRQREEARLALAHLAADALGAPHRGLLALAATASRVLGVERVGVWALAADGALRCEQLVDAGKELTDRPVLSVGELGPYERAMRERRVIAANDVRTDPWTRDLVDGYFRDLGIVSTLDAPIWIDGHVVGVVCHEHRGTIRTWSDHDAELALSVGEVAASIIRGAQLRAATEALARAEERMGELLRRDQIRRVTQGVAHDLNNLLAAAWTTSEVLDRKPAPERLPELAATLRDVVTGARRLCEQLVGASGARAPVVIDDVIGSSERTLRAQLGDDRRLRLELDAPGAKVRIDRAELERVLSNLVTNAREATVPGGRVAIRTRVEHEIDPEGGDVLELVIDDDGTGMDALTRTRIFAPYFSSKGGHRGLGLATVLQIVEQAEGTIHVESEPAQGARFVIRLPIERG